jgi:hypothetical protein
MRIKMSGLIFISYRRGDSLATTGRLYDHLKVRLGADRIFMDLDAIEPGLDFVEAIEQAVGRCDVLLAVIGSSWLRMLEDEKRRSSDHDDFVGLEIGAALKRNIRVIPILVDGTPMPRANDLPEELKPLVRRNAFELSHKHFGLDVERLIQVLERASIQVKTPASSSVGSEKVLPARLLEAEPVVSAEVGKESGIHERVAGEQQIAKPAPNRKIGKGTLVIALILFVLWALGFFAFHIAGGLVHIVLLLAVVMAVLFLANARTSSKGHL